MDQERRQLGHCEDQCVSLTLGQREREEVGKEK